MPNYLSQSDVDAFRSRLRTVAEQQFAERGPEAVSMRSLADALGCSATTPYRYFKNKEEILAAVRAATLDRFAAKLEAAAARTGDALERSRAVGDAYVTFAFEEPRAYRLIFDSSQPDAADYPDLARAAARARRTMVGYVEQMVNEGYLQGNPELLGYVFWGGIHGLIMLHMAGKLSDHAPAFETVRAEMMRLIGRGARVQPTGPSPGRAIAADSRQGS